MNFRGTCIISFYYKTKYLFIHLYQVKKKCHDRGLHLGHPRDRRTLYHVAIPPVKYFSLTVPTVWLSASDVSI